MANMAMGAGMRSGVPTQTASRLCFSLASIRRQSGYTRTSGHFTLSGPSCVESTSATQTSFTLGWRSSWSMVTNAMPPAPKAPRRNWPLGGAEIRFRTKNGAARSVRRSIRRGMKLSEEVGRRGTLWVRLPHVMSLYDFGDDEGLAIVARHQGGGFLIAGDRHGLGIEINGSSHAIRDVGQVHQHGGRGALLNLCRESFLLAIAHGFEEIGEVATALAHGGPGFAILAEEGGGFVVARDGQGALGAVEDAADGGRVLAALADAGFVVAHLVAHLEFHHLLLAVLIELERAVEAVRRFLIVVEHELAADGTGLGGELDAQAPARDIDFVNALVAEVAVAVGPIPVPVAVEAVFLEWHLLRRTLPQVVIHIRRGIAHGLGADGVAPLVAQAAGEVDVADQTFAHLPHAVLQRHRGAALAALLHHPVVLAGRRHDLFDFEDIMRARLLDVDVLAGAARVDGHQRVPVIGGGDRDGVDRLVFQQLAVVRVN